MSKTNQVIMTLLFLLFTACWMIVAYQSFVTTRLVEQVMVK